MIRRNKIHAITDYCEVFPVVAIVGPRQCGKTTLAKQYLSDLSTDHVYIDLERPSDRFKLEKPEEFISHKEGAVICLDEIQRMPCFFEVLRSVCDDSDAVGRFLVLGSASPELLKQTSETLAGRIGYIELTPFLVNERGVDDWRALWCRGGFPRSYLAKSISASYVWREQFVATFLERDLPQLGIRIASTTMRRFWEMCAHVHGELWNASKISASMGVTAKMINHYLDILESAYIIRVLRPLERNTKKRLVKTPKIYLRDTGILHVLLRIKNYDEMMGHPVWGASWEGFCIEQIMNNAGDWDASFYRTSAGAELDLVLQQGTKTIAFEFKASRAPKVTKGFWMALEDVCPDETYIVAPVDDAFEYADGIKVMPISDVVKLFVETSINSGE